MKPCEHCATALLNVWHGGYSADCAGCTARSCARSLDAFNALHQNGSGDKQGLREQIARRFPQAEQEKARKEVWAWWQRDHAQPSESD